MTNEEIKSCLNNWTCWKCTDAQTPQPDAPMPNRDTSIDDVATGMKSNEKKCMRILQWNTDGIKSKIGELEMRLKKRDIDLAMIQESKLGKGQRTPHIKGYIAMREDRQGARGGGLINYIRIV